MPADTASSSRAGPQAESALARLIAPVHPAEFRASHLEREPLLVQRRDPDYFAELLTLDDIDRLLSSLTFRQQDIRLANCETPVKRSDYMSGSELDRGKLFALFERGASVVFERLDGKWPPLRRFCRGIERDLRQPLQANAYMTPGGTHGQNAERAQGLRRHYDTHDVFILQVAGRKTWNLCDAAIPLPLKS